MDFFWGKDGWEHDDRHLKKMQGMPFQRRFPFIPTQWAIEVKWSQITAHLSRAYLQMQIPQKLVWTHGNFLKEWPKNFKR